jgi:nucleotide sugar dehydrogenase
MKSTKKIGIVGYGYVGKAVHELFKDHYEIFIYDPAYDKNTKEEINECDLVIVCVPTPEASDGHCDVSIVETSVAWIEASLILIKSTVYPGTTKRLVKTYDKAIAFSPEFVGESSYYHPFWNKMIEEPHLIIGGKKETRETILNFFLPVLGPTKTYGLTDSTTAELVKYMENIYYAMKVTFSNEFYQIAETFGVSYPELRELWALDPRVDKMHTTVFPDKRGFGGKCFPKDLAGLIDASVIAGYNPEFLEEIRKSNKRFLKMNK